MGLISLLSVDFLQVLIPLVIKRAVDALTFKTATSGVLLDCGMIILAIALAIALLRYTWRYLLLGHSRVVEMKLRNRLYQHLQTLSPSFFHRMKTGDIMARSINDINAIRMATGMGLVAMTDGLVLGVAAIGFMISINLYLTLIALIPAPLVIYLTRVLTRRMSTGYERVQKRFSDLTERVREAFSGIRVVKAYGREPWECEKIEAQGRMYIKENMRLAKSIAFLFPMMAILPNLGLAIAIWIGGRLTILGQITTGEFVAFIGYMNLLTWPMMAVGWVTNLLQRGSASMRRINRILDEAPEITGPAHPHRLPQIRGNIRFRDFTLQYPGQKAHAVKDIRFTIEAGQTVALVGRVGSGKTTLLEALPRLVDGPRGTVFIDGVDVRELSLKTLRESIGFATQESIIFSDTIRNNVLFGRESLSISLDAALHSAQIYEEIQAFEHGVDTLLGERGITLSGGQRQRLSIARALLSDPPILILDDALSMVDTRTEEQILNRVLESRKNKTTLIVSHRLSTISRADFIAVLDRGELAEFGDHRSLLNLGNEYARLYERQLLEQELETAIG